jgi:predicted PurR-regulated permease PerM
LNSHPLSSSTEEKISIVTRTPWKRRLLFGLFVVFALFFFWCVKGTLPPFLIAFFVASLLDPLVTRLHKRGISRMRAVGSIYIAFFLFLILLGLLIIPSTVRQLNELSRNINRYSSNLSLYTREALLSADNWYEGRRGTLSALGIKEKPSDYLNNRTGPLSKGITRVLASVQGFIVGFIGQVLWLIIFPLAVFYFLLDYPLIRAKLISFFPVTYRPYIDRISRDIIDIFSSYIRSLAIVCTFYGVVASLLFWALGLKYALFMGLAAGALYAVPYVGPTLAFSGAFVLALTTGQSVTHAGIIVLCLILMHLSIDYGVTPRVVGGSVGLHPLMNIFALMAGATLFGLWGMLLAVPCAATIQMVLCYFIPELSQKPPLSYSMHSSEMNMMEQDKSGI